MSYQCAINPVTFLPPELLLSIWSNFDCPTLLTASMTSKSWYGLCKDPLLWQRLCEREGWTTSRPPATQNPTHLSAPFASPSRINSAPDWYDVYKQRSRLMDNWRAGRFANFQLPRPDRGHEGHAGDVYTIQLHGKHLLSGGLDGTIRVWNLDTCRLVGSPLRGHQDGVLCLQFDPRKHEDTIISGSGNGELIFWQFSTRAIVKLVSLVCWCSTLPLIQLEILFLSRLTH